MNIISTNDRGYTSSITSVYYFTYLCMKLTSGTDRFHKRKGVSCSFLNTTN